MTNKPTHQQLAQVAKECAEAQDRLEKLGLIKLFADGNCKSTKLGRNIKTVLEFMDREYVLIEAKNDN
jgi:hypothetical protein